MKKAKETSNSQLKEIIQNVFSTTLISHLKDTAQKILHQAQEVAYHTEKKIIQMLVASLLLFSGIFFIATGLAFLINNLFLLEVQWGFIFVGFGLALISIIMIFHFKKTKFKEWR